MRDFQLNDTNNAAALLGGEIDVYQYWRESGLQQVKSAGVVLTQQQQDRALKNLTRLSVSLKRVEFCLAPIKNTGAPSDVDCAGLSLQRVFDQYLATYR